MLIKSSGVSVSDRRKGSAVSSFTFFHKRKSLASTASSVSTKSAKPFNVAGKRRNFVANWASRISHSAVGRVDINARMRQWSKTVAHFTNFPLVGLKSDKAEPTTIKRCSGYLCCKSFSKMPRLCVSFQHKRISPS